MSHLQQNCSLKIYGGGGVGLVWGGGGVRVGGVGGGRAGVRVDVSEELKFLCKFKKKYFFFWGGGGGGEGRKGSDWGGSGWM